MSYTISAPNSAPAFAESADSALEIVLVAESDDQDLSALNMNGVDVVDLDGHTGVLIGTDQLSVATTGSGELQGHRDESELSTMTDAANRRGE